MGNKVSAKDFALEAGLPIGAGSTGPIEEDTHKKAEEIGYPIIIKAASGGGGRGISDSISVLSGISVFICV